MEKVLAELIARMQKVDADQNEIERQAKLENDGIFTDEQRTQYEALDAMFESLKSQKEQIEKDLERTHARATREEILAPKILTRHTKVGSGAPIERQSATDNGLPVEIENSETGESQIRFKIPKNVRRGGSLENFHGTVDGYSAEHRAYRFGQWVLNAVSYAMPGRYNFEFAKEFVKNYLPTNTAHSESDGTTGGHYLVPDEFSRDLIVLRETYGVARKIFGRAPMTGDILHTPRRASGLTAYFVGENAAGTESNMTWNDVQLSAKNLMCISRMSNQLNADAVISIGDTLAGEIAYAFSNKEDDCAFNGDGTSTYGGIQGVRTLLTSIDAGGTDSKGVYTQATSNTWNAQVLADFNNVVALLPQYADTPNTTWVCHKTYYAGVMQRLELAAGGNTIMEIANGDRRPRPMFLGYPVTFSQIFPSATATTGVTAALGDFTQGALFGDRQQTSIAFSEHATIGSENVFERNQIAVRGTERIDIVVHGCGTSAVVGPIVGLQTA